MLKTKDKECLEKAICMLVKKDKKEAAQRPKKSRRRRGEEEEERCSKRQRSEKGGWEKGRDGGEDVELMYRRSSR